MRLSHGDVDRSGTSPPVGRRLHGAVTYGRTLPRRAMRRAMRLAGRHLLGTITHVVTSDPVAALTFDDGPHPETTPRLLDVLERHGAKATFFMLGRHARLYPDLVGRVAAAGHAIANHSFDHPRFPDLSHKERRRQIQECHAALAPYGLKLFRPPRGLQSAASRIDALLLGYDVVTWNVIAEDWEIHSPEWTASRLRSQVTPGSIVLLHDLLYEADVVGAEDRSATFAGIDLFLAEAKSRLSFLPLPELLARGRPYRGNWFVRTDDDWSRHNPT